VWEKYKEIIKSIVIEGKICYSRFDGAFIGYYEPV